MRRRTATCGLVERFAFQNSLVGRRWRKGSLDDADAVAPGITLRGAKKEASGENILYGNKRAPLGAVHRPVVPPDESYKW